MARDGAQRINIGLAVLALAGAAFGVYGIFFHHIDSPLPPAMGDNVAARGDDGANGPAAAHEAPADRVQPSRPEISGDTAAPPPTVERRGEPAMARDPQPELRYPPSDPGMASISGRVADENGQPFAGVAVSVVRDELPRLQPHYDTSGDVENWSRRSAEFAARLLADTRRTMTGEDGAFTTGGLDGSRSYTVTARAPTGATWQQSNIAAGDMLDITVMRGVEIRGKLICPDGELPPSFTLCILDAANELTTYPVTPGAEGRFRLGRRMESQTYRLYAECWGYSRGDETTITYVAGAPFIEIEVSLRRGSVFSGSVLGPGETVLANTQLLLQPLYGSIVGQPSGSRARIAQRTNSLGQFRFASIPAGAYRVSVENYQGTWHYDLGEIALAEGVNARDFVVEAPVIMIVRGTDATGQPVPVSLSSMTRVQPAAERVDLVELRRRPPSAAPGDEKRYLCPDAGRFIATFSTSGLPVQHQDITLVEGTNDVKAIFADACVLSGTVSVPAAMARGLRQYWVELLPAGLDEYEISDPARTFVTPDGTYKFGPVKAGTWTARLGCNDSPYSTRRKLQRADIELRPGANTRDFIVSGGGSLTLRYTDHEGKRLRSGYATASISGVGEPITAEISFNSGEEETYLPWLPAGAYRIDADGRTLVSRGPTGVTIAPGEHCETVIALVPPDCVRIVTVYPDSRAANAGMEVGDLVFEYNGQPITSTSSFVVAYLAAKGETRVTMQIVRSGAPQLLIIEGGSPGTREVNAVR